MRRNYALDEDEVERGFVLTCQSHAVSDEVTVDFDDESVGRKRLVVAYAGLERGFD